MSWSTPESQGSLKQLGEDIWMLEYPLRFIGMELGRRVSVLRLTDGSLVCHSSGPFTEDQVKAINQLGRVDIVVEGTTMHDTFSRQARSCFPDSVYLVPEGFPKKKMDAATRSIDDLDRRTGGQLKALRLEGMRLLTEYACFHPRSRSLILCDLLFNLNAAKGWTRWSMSYLLGVKRWPAIDRPVRMAVADPVAFAESIHRVFEWDFDRIVVAHGSVIESDGKRQLRSALERADFGG